MKNPNIENQHLLCFPEIKRYILRNEYSGVERLVTMKMLDSIFEDNEDELMKVKSGRSRFWFLEDYFE